MKDSTDYTLAEFSEAYDLETDQAERIFNLSGPSKVKLDVFMRVYKQPKAAENLFFASDR
ncbi:hypothetical protein J2T09_004893 [Neorhizobium huautlense]|uniref:Uncharacterized protein n=1 Tax=Neorhizobium huautlense TaxID=67774 RepID=A0ABT9Q059_9HYPH|nr:hypothetical protein [Neorhizobium huautlense]MDP9840113.1 hypothetical protein [Neorhizobium huautlense]